MVDHFDGAISQPIAGVSYRHSVVSTWARQTCRCLDLLRGMATGLATLAERSPADRSEPDFVQHTGRGEYQVQSLRNTAALLEGSTLATSPFTDCAIVTRAPG